MTDRPLRLFLLAFLLTALTAAVARGQGRAEVVRGRVTGDSGKIVPATVTVVRGPDRLTQSTTTDSAGYYSVHFEEGTGDYLVTVASPGMTTARRRVQRQANERELVANFVLAIDVTVLAATRVTAVQPVRASNNVSPSSCSL